MFLWCVACNQNVFAVLTDGREIYPHREDLQDLPFWKCPTCGNYVGCYHKTGNRTKPLGNIPTAELRVLRLEIHKIIDPLWKYGGSRKFIYRKLSEALGRKYHTAELRSVEEAKKIIEAAKSLADEPSHANPSD
jgi:hypothetical protein